MSQIMQSDQNRAKHFACHKQMPQVTTAISSLTSWAIAFFIDGPWVVCKLGISKTHLACGRECIGIAGISGWQDAIEHINACFDGSENIPLVADPH